VVEGGQRSLLLQLELRRNAQKLFVKFVEIWNAGKLSAKYYQGIAAAPRTAHKWGIKLNRDENAVLGEILRLICNLCDLLLGSSDLTVSLD
jgi:hypothetical protein